MTHGIHKVYIVKLLSILIALTGDVRSGGSHYPDEKYNRKPCVRRKNTINYQKPICADHRSEQLMEESIRNCEGEFRTSTCPEFNRGSCERCNVTLSPNTYRLVKCCKLSYYSKKTWAEVFYANQYALHGVDESIAWDVVEIQRKIIKTDAFGDRNQPNWPDSVQDFKGERGLIWKTQENPDRFPIIDSKTPICTTGSDTRCTEIFYNYLKDNWVNGFNSETRDIKPSQWEISNNATITYELQPRCRDIYILPIHIKTTACQVIYTRRAKFNYSTNQYTSSFTPVTRLHDSSFEFLEVQLFNHPSNKWTVRYASWNQEPAETRDEIFSNGA